ncbi:MAG TPA: hypothetical protein VFW48_08240 [Solirubrobacterales bacterium]|nr:hypothetical protein [Solirubrobacterales bacterium]
MKVSAGKFPTIRLALVAATISAAFLMLTAACAQGEAAGGAVPLASATEDAVSTEETPAAASPVEAPAEAPEPKSAVEAVGDVVETASTAIESNPATSTASAATETVREATSETARKATGAVTSSAGATGPTTVVTATGGRASKLLDEVGQVTAKAAAAAGDQAGRLSGLPEGAGAQRVADVAALGNPPQAERLAQPAGTPPSGVPASPGEGPLAVSPAFRGKAPSVNADGGALAASYRGFAGAGLSWLGALAGLDGIHSVPMNSMTGTPPDDRTPLDGPITPAPGSSGAAAGPTGSFFVPLAALLALLALAAPAVLRRFGEAPDFRPPTPFVCALERPG